MRLYLRLMGGLMLLWGQVVAAELSGQEILQTASQIESSMSARDSSVFIRLFDQDAFLDRITKNVPANADYRNAFLTDSRDQYAQRFCSELVAMLKKHDSYHYLHPSELGGEAGILFRVYANGRIDYHNLILGKDAAGAVRVLDVYTAESGDKISEIGRRMYILGAIAVEKEAGHAPVPESVDALRKMNAATQAKKYADVISIYASLSEACKREHHLCLIQLNAALHIDHATYARSVAEVQKYLTNDVAIDLLSFNTLTIDQQYGQAIQSLDRIDQAVGGDVLLLSLKATVLRRAGKNAEALQLAQDAVEKGPDEYHAHSMLLTMALREKRNDLVLQELRAMARQFKMSFSTDFNKSKLYDDFIQSPEYQQWLKSR